jgi:hypothetical protein
VEGLRLIVSSVELMVLGVGCTSGSGGVRNEYRCELRGLKFRM